MIPGANYPIPLWYWFLRFYLRFSWNVKGNFLSLCWQKNRRTFVFLQKKDWKVNKIQCVVLLSINKATGEKFIFTQSLALMKLLPQNLLQNLCWGIVCTVNLQKIFPILSVELSFGLSSWLVTEPNNEQLNLKVVRKKTVRAGHKSHLEKLSNTVDDILVAFETSVKKWIAFD